MSDAFPTLREPNVDINLYPNASNAGIAAGHSLPTNLTSGITGAIEGVKTGIDLTTGIQSIQANAQNAEIRQNTIDQLPVANALQQANVDNTTAEAQLRQAQVANLPVKMQLEQQNAANDAILKKAQADKALLDAKKTKLQLDKADQDNSRDANVTQMFSGLNPVSGETSEAAAARVKSAVGLLSENLSDVARTVFEKDKNGVLKGIDTAFEPYIQDLVSTAQKTGDAETIQKAQSIVTKLQNAGNATKDAANPKSKLEFNPTPPTPDVPFNSDQTLLESVGVNTAAKNSAPPITQAPAGPIIAAADQTAPVAAPNGPTQIAPTDGNALPQDNPLAPAATPSKDSGALAAVRKVEEDEDVPVSKRVFDSTVSEKDLRDKVVDARIAVLKKQNPTANQGTIIKQAHDELKNQFQYAAPDEKEYNKLITGAQNARAKLAQAGNILAQITDLEKKGVSADLGPGAFDTAGRLISKATPGDNSKILTSLYNQLDGIGSLSTLMEIANLGFGTRTIDTEKEQVKFSALSFGSNRTPKQNQEAYAVMDSVVKSLNDRIKIFDVYHKRGKSYTETTQAVERYDLNNPAIVDSINDEGIPTVATNPNKEDVFKYLDRTLQWGKYADRQPNGRVVLDTGNKSDGPAAAPTSKPTSDIGVNRINYIDRQDPSKMSDYITPLILTGGKGLPSGNDIPDFQPGGVNAATMARLVNVESSFNPNAIGPETKHGTAKGLTQLIDGTGKEMWSKLEYDGPYDPLDPGKNIAMGTKYLNSILPFVNNDTRLALASFNAGPNTVLRAVDIAQRVDGDISWAAVQKRMTQFQSPENAKQTRDYVSKIMGDGEHADPRVSTTPLVEASLLGSLPSEKSKDWARKNLTDDGFKAFEASADQKTPQDFKGVLATAFNKIFDALDPASTASAEELPTPNTDISNISVADRAVLVTPTPASVAEEVTPSPKALENYNKQPNGLQAAALGFTNMLSFGFDDELYAPLGMVYWGVSYGEAVDQIRNAQDAVYAAHPHYYQAGMAAAVIPAAITTDLALGGLKAAKTVVGLGKSVKKVNDLSKALEVSNALAPTVLKAVGQGVKVGAGAGFTAGVGGSEGSWEQRIKGGIEGGLLGALLGGPTGVVGAKLQARAARTGILNTLTKVAGGNAEGLSIAEKEVLKKLMGMTPQELEQVQKALLANKNSAKTLTDIVPDGRLHDYLDSIAHDPTVQTNIQKVKNISKAGTADRIEESFNPTPPPGAGTSVPPKRFKVSSEQAADNAGANIKKTTAAMDNKIKATYEPIYNQAKNAAPKYNAKPKIAARENQFHADLQDTTDELNKQYQRDVNILNTKGGKNFQQDLTKRKSKLESDLINAKKAGYTALERDVKKLEAYHGTNLFQGGAVKVMLKDEDVARAIAAVRVEVPSLGKEPRNSFDVLQATKQHLFSQYRTASGVVRGRLKDAHDLVKNTLARNNPTYAKADEAFSKAVIKSDEYYSAFTTSLDKLLNENGGVKDIPAFHKLILGAENRQFAEFFKSMDAAGKQSFKDLFTDIAKTEAGKEISKLTSAGKRTADFLKTSFGQKLETVYGNKEAQRMINDITDEQGISATSNMVEKAGTKTDQRAAERAQRSKENIAIRGSYIAAAAGIAAVFPNPGTGLALLGASVKWMPGIIKDIRAGQLDKAVTQVSKIIYEDPQAAKEFINKVSNNLKANSKALEIWKKVSLQAGQVASRTTNVKQPNRVKASKAQIK